MKILKKAFGKNAEFCLCLCEVGDAQGLALAEGICFPGDPWSEGMFRSAFENPSCRIYAVSDMQMSKIFAYAVYYVCGDEADLANIATLPELRRQGIGGALLDETLEISRSGGVFRAFLEVRESNESARALYSSRGFIEIGKRRRYYRNPTEDAILMAKFFEN
ncbi:MAG: ribosomal-protein-alanine N-acetyltransferase [Ruminococcaceae bacterium]|nr:ribosomal-protein-alanine N-acetyltransferase [Oscillospiraceae bacterium]